MSTSPRFAIYRRYTNELVEGGFFSRTLAQAYCDEHYGRGYYVSVQS